MALALVLVATLLGTSTSAADTRIPENFNNQPTLAHSGAMGYNLAGIAVSERESGDIYFPNAESLQRVDVFAPDGSWARAFGFGVVPGAATASGDLTAGTALVTNVSTLSGSLNQGGLGGKIVSGPGIPPNTWITAIRPTEIELSNQVTVTASGATLTAVAGPGNVPVNEQQELRVRAAAGQFTLQFISPKPGSSTLETPPLNYNAGAVELQSALEGLSNIGAGNVSVTGGPGDGEGTHPYLIEFEQKFADTNVRPLTTTNVSLSGGSPSSSASVTSPTEGGGTAEACTTVCGFPSADENINESGQGFGGPQPGSFSYSDEIAVDNDPASESYGDVYVVDQRHYRVEKFSGEGQLLLMFGGEINQTKVAEREEQEANSEPVTVTEAEENLCTAANLSAGDLCEEGVPGTGPSHFYRGAYPRQWDQTGNNSIAVGPAGRVYVGDYGRVQEFDQHGAFQGELALPDAEPRFVTALAVDASGNIFERSTINNEEPDFSPPVSEVPGVREYSSLHTLVRTVDTEAGSEPFRLSLDDQGNLFVADRNSGEFEFKRFSPTGVLSAVFESEQVPIFNSGDNRLGRVHGIAVGSGAGNLYVTSGEFEGGYVAVIHLPVAGPPGVGEEEASNLEPETATLHAIVNPHGYDTEYHFEYVDQHSFETEGGFASPNTQRTSSVDLGLVDRENPVQAPISGLHPGATYHFRVVAASSEGTSPGPDETFSSLDPVSVREFTTQTVGPELVTLKMELNPNGLDSTYSVRFGKTIAYTGGSSGGMLEIGNEFVPEEVTFNDLEPNTTYHYQLIAENGYGVTETVDQTFITEPSLAEEGSGEACTNQNLREENLSLRLPDCRAYEQVSAVHKEGGEAFPLIYLAQGGEREMYIANGAFAGAATDEIAVEYLAQRSDSGWATTVPIRRLQGSDYQPGNSGTLTLSPELDRWSYTQQHGINFEHQDPSSVFFSMGFADGNFIPNATEPLTDAEGGPVRVSFDAQSEDLSKEFILTTSPLLPSDPRPTGNTSNGDRLYELNGLGTPTRTLKLLAETPLGLTDSSCTLSSFADGIAPPLSGNGHRMVSTDGSTVVYTAPVEVIAGQPCGGEGKTANQFALYAITNEGTPVQINKPLPSECHAPSLCASSSLVSPLYDGMAADGSRIWFTTTQPLVDADKDETNDLYMGRMENGQVAELVLASEGEPTANHPTPGKEAEIGEEGINGYSNAGGARLSQNGALSAFESMRVLTNDENSQGKSAVAGANNLYIFDAESSETKFVTELCSGIEFSGSDRQNRSGPGVYYEVTAKNAVHDSECPRKAVAGFENLIGYGGPCGNNDDMLWIYECGGGEAVFSDNGRYFYFTSWARLTPDDTDNVKDLYRYDTTTGQLMRVSFGKQGNDANGNSDKYPVQFENGLATTRAFAQAGGEERRVSSDGSRVIFRTAEPLVSRDTNTGADPTCGEGVQGTGCDVYQWEEDGTGSCHEAGGCISLISDGLEPHGTPSAVMSASGRDIMFETQRNEIPTDTDGVGDIYDARINGGFHTLHGASECSSPEACRPPHGTEPLPPTTGSQSFVGSGNAKAHLSCAKGRRRVIRHGQPRCVARQHRHKMRGKRAGHGGKPHRSARVASATPESREAK